MKTIQGVRYLASHTRLCAVPRQTRTRVQGEQPCFDAPSPAFRLLPPTQTKRQKQIRGETREDAKTITIVEYTFQCVRLLGGAKIKAFMNKAFEWYTEEMAATEDNNRYMWVCRAGAKEEEEEEPVLAYTAVYRSTSPLFAVRLWAL